MNKICKIFKQMVLVFLIFIISLLTLNCTNQLKILLYDEYSANNIISSDGASAIYFFNDLLDSSGNDHHLVRDQEIAFYMALPTKAGF